MYPNSSDMAKVKVFITVSISPKHAEPKSVFENRVNLKTSLSRKLNNLEAFPVDDGRTGLVVLLLADPHLLEGGQRSQDGTTDPDGVFPLGWGNDLILRCLGR